MENINQIKPRAAWLTVNRRCNFRCKWCYAEGTGYSSKKEMSYEFAKTLAILLQQIGVNRLLLIGGEPTLWAPLLRFNEFCVKEGLESILITNGSSFGNERFWERYKQYPNTKIALSLKASTPSQLREVAGVSNFRLIKRGIVRAITEIGAQVSITYNTFYIDNLVDMVQFAVDCGAASVKIDFCSVVFNHDRPDSTYMVPPDKLVKNILRDYPKLESLTNGHIVFEMMLPFCLWPLEFIQELKQKNQLLSVCHLLKRQGIIFDEEGNLIMCNALFDYPIARYREDFDDGQSLLTCLNTPKIRKLYDRMGCYPSVKCKDCDWYSECGGGCPLRWSVYKPEELIRPIKKATRRKEVEDYA